MDPVSETLLDYLDVTAYEHLSTNAVHAVKRCLVDALGCAYGAFWADPVRALRRVCANTFSVRPATVLGTPIRTSPEMAALVNGVMVRFADFSDDYFSSNEGAGPHPSDNIGGVLAAVEHVGGSGRDLIAAVALAYEICGQLVDSTKIRDTGWDYTVFHSIASSLAASKVMQLTRVQAGHALALAVVPHVALAETRRDELSHWKAVAGPYASRAGVFAAMLAREGVTGPAMPFSGKAGLARQLGLSFDVLPVGSLSEIRMVERSYFKSLPVRYGWQLPIYLAIRLRDLLNLNEIDSIVVRQPARYVVDKTKHAAAWDPQTRETADHSGPFLVTAGLIDGTVSSSTFTSERYRDPHILAMMRRVTVVEEPTYTAVFPQRMVCRLDVRLTSGELVSVEDENPRGHPGNPMTDDELTSKFLHQATDVLGSDGAHSVVAALLDLNHQTHVSGVFQSVV